MRKMRKQILTLMLIVSVMLTAVPSSVSAITSGDCGKSLKWSLDDNGTLTVSGEGEMFDYNYYVQDGKGYSNTPWCNEMNSIKRVIFEEGITRIGNCAFRDCDNLTEVTFSNGLIEIGSGAFMFTDISKVVLPDSVKTLDSACFQYCFMLNDIYLGKSLEYIGRDVFSDDSSFDCITIPKSVRYIGERAFARCGLNTIYYEGTKEQWNNIDKSAAWDYQMENSDKLIIITKKIKKNTDYASYNPNSINVSIDGNYIKFDVQPQIINGRTLVPMRKIFEELGVTVDWDDSTRTAIGIKGNTIVKFKINDYTMYKNESVKALDVPAQLIDGRTLIPLRAVSEAFGCQVGWDGKDSIVSIIDDSEKYTMLYALNDRSKSFPSNDVDAQLTVGWYTEPVQILYTLGKSEVFKKSDIADQLAVGWYEEPVQKLYFADGRREIFKKSEVSKLLQQGWSEEPHNNIYKSIVTDLTKDCSWGDDSWVKFVTCSTCNGILLYADQCRICRGKGVLSSGIDCICDMGYLCRDCRNTGKVLKAIKKYTAYEKEIVEKAKKGEIPYLTSDGTWKIIIDGKSVEY